MSIIDQTEYDYIILGLGSTGLSCLEFLYPKKYKLLALDTRECPPNLENIKNKYPDLAIQVGNLDQILIKINNRKSNLDKKNTKIIISPGLDPKILKNIDIPVITDIELFCRSNQKPVIGITGSNGKSTTVSLVGDILKQARKKVVIGGNIGIPALTLLTQEYDFCVLELSSFQLENTNFLPLEVACILNISADHLDRHGSMEEYTRVKEKIYQQAKHIIYVNHNIDKTYQNKNLLGKHNQLNIQVAVDIAKKLNIDTNSIKTAVSNFQPLQHRANIVVRTKNTNVLWVNDSKATNVGATESSLMGLQNEINGKWILFLGGIDKGGDYNKLAQIIKQSCKAVLIMGQATEKIYAALHTKIVCYKIADLKSGIILANQLVDKNDGVLLAPACSSFDMFKDYIHRGELFTKLVRENVCEK